MSLNKEVLLANFQNITNCDSVAEAFSWLEENNWNLESALYEFMHQNKTNDVVKTNKNSNSHSTSKSNQKNDLPGPSTTTTAIKDLKDENEIRYLLIILQQPEDNMIELEYFGTQTILGVKSDIFHITGIDVQHQDWTGWPEGTTNSTTLAQSSIELVHNLILKSTAENDNRSETESRASTNNTNESGVQGNGDIFESVTELSVDDDLFFDMPTKFPNRFLISDNINDEASGSIQFIQNYIQRYGEPYPNFYQGTLKDAVKEAFDKPLKDRKPLAIYLHHDGSVLTNIFCDQLLKSKNALQIFPKNFILYGWDFTFKNNKTLFLSSLTSCIGKMNSNTIQNITIDNLPAIIIIAKYRPIYYDIITVIYGNIGVDSFTKNLLKAIEFHSINIELAKQEENKREVTAKIKFEQDMAYEETLKADIVKDKLKKQKEINDAAEKQRQQNEKATQNAIKEANRQKAENSLPTEPSETVTKDITIIRIRDPNGKAIQRRFHCNDTLNDLLNFVRSKGFPIENYKVLSNWPRQDLSLHKNKNATLKELNLCPKENVFLEER